MRSFRNRRAALGLVTAVVVLASVLPAAAQSERKQQDKLEQAQRAEAQALARLVDDTAAGSPVETNLPFTWEQHHIIRGQGDTIYVPFTLAFEPGALSSRSIGLYLRVAKQGDAAPAPAEPAAKSDAKTPDRPTYAFEDLYFFDVPAAVAGEPQRVRRAFAVPPGDYDVYVAIREGGTDAAASAESAPAAAGNAPAAPKMGAVKQTLSLPSLGAELATSSVIVAAKVDVLEAPLPTDRQADHPYTFGQMAIVPAVEHRFTKKDELSLIFWIYGAALDAAKKPDVAIEYKFHQKTNDKETYFNKTEPQLLNASTLPPHFDLTTGQGLPGSLAVPLASFPEGDYRLEIEIQDKLANKKVTRDVAFTVLGQ